MMRTSRRLLLAGVVAALVLPAAGAQDQEKEKEKPPADLAAETATHEELEPLDVEFKRISALRLHTNGNLLACDGEAHQIKILSPEGKQTGTIQLEFSPESIDVADDGTIYCGGKGQLAKLDKDGRLLKSVKAPKGVDSPIARRKPTGRRKPEEEGKSDGETKPGAETRPDGETKLGAEAKPGGETKLGAETKPDGEKREGERRRRRPRSRGNRVSGIAVSKGDVFVAFGSGWSLGSKSKLFRFDRELENPKMLAEGLRGCCQRCDIAFHEGVVYLAENSVHRVVLYDREGQVLGKWGKRSRTEIEDFGACCNPMNISFDSEGVLYTAEAGIGRVKRYAPDGKYLSLVGYMGTARFERGSGLAASCSNMAIAVLPKGKRVYVMDYKDNRIRVLQERE